MPVLPGPTTEPSMDDALPGGTVLVIDDDEDNVRLIEALLSAEGKAGAQECLSKPFDCEELLARVRSLARLRRQTDELESAESVIMSLALVVEARDAYTSGHCERMATYATIFGAALGMPMDVIETLRRGAYLHDVGKVGIPDSILLKQSPLTVSEFAVMQRHTTIGDAVCANMRSLASLRPIVRHHHERLDGSGYPDGLAGDDVHFLAQIVAICDTYDAMTTKRPYRDALCRGDARRELLEDGRRGKLNATFVDVFVGLLMNDHFTSRNTS